VNAVYSRCHLELRPVRARVERLARLSYRHARLVLAAIGAFVVASVVLGHALRNTRRR